VIRRGFWLLLGATGGVLGYRRVSALSRQVSQTLGTRTKRPGAAKRHWARESIRFTRDVREGMDLYSARHPRPSGPTLGPETSDPETSDPETGGAGTRGAETRDPVTGAGNQTGHDKREDH
jgi:hypothetical protein